MPGVKGDFKALDALIFRVEAIAGKGPNAEQFRHELLTACASAAHSALEDSFATSTDPYGNKWKAVRSRTGKPLLDTGVLASSYKFSVTRSGFAVGTGLYYAATHQYGAIIRAKNAPYLRFAVRGTPTVKNPRGPLSWVRAKQVTIPQRQQVPEESTGGMGTWGDAVNEAAADTMAEWLRKV